MCGPVSVLQTIERILNVENGETRQYSESGEDSRAL